jgi:branched-subunit amino acid aminotransferase/4-amino-4-deoxychorismate lyase
MKSPYCYLNGKIARLDQLSLPLNDLSVLRGFGVFDFLRTHGGKPFQMKAHVERFMRSAKMLGLSVPHSPSELARIAEQLVTKNGFKETTIKFVLTGGSSEDGLTRTGKPNFFVLAGEAHDPAPELYTKGAHLKTLEYQRPIPEAKSLNYLISVQHQKELKKNGITELLYVQNGEVRECSSSNVFIVKKGKLITPREHILLGTTRNILIQKIVKGIPVEEREVSVQELRSADEVFITASNKRVMPVTRIDGKKVGKGIVGPVTKKLMQAYEEYICK